MQRLPVIYQDKNHGYPENNNRINPVIYYYLFLMRE